MIYLNTIPMCFVKKKKILHEFKFMRLDRGGYSNVCSLCKKYHNPGESTCTTWGNMPIYNSKGTSAQTICYIINSSRKYKNYSYIICS
jgi:hypothetical protein